MKRKTNLLLIFIILLIIIIISILIALVKINNNARDNITNNELDYIIDDQETASSNMNSYEIPGEIEGEIGGEPTIETYNYKLEYVSDRKNYFTIQSILDKYIRVLDEKNKKSTLNMLSPLYKSKYNITDSNIFEVLQVPELENTMQYYKTNITEMLTTQTDYTTHVYIIKAKCRIVGKNTTFEIKIMIEIDEENQLYYIYPEQYIKDNGFDNLKQGDILKYTKEEIKNTESNKFSYITKTDVEMANEYFYHYNELIKYYPDEAFEKLNSEYMQKRFGNKENFQNHLKENSKVLSYMQIDKYKVYSTSDYTDYICTDKYDNLYIFRQQGGIMRYNVFLDNYTVRLPEYADEYDKKDKFDKAKSNIRKFINMVNTKDYNAIYNSLDPTFRANNFQTVEDLKQFIKNNMYGLNEIETKDYETEKYKYYVFIYKLINLENDKENKEMTIIINQTEGTEFTMSFSFEQ